MRRAEERGSDSSNEITTSSGPVHVVNRKPNEACGLVQCQYTMTGTVTGKGDKDMGHGHGRRRTVRRNPSTVNVWPLLFRAHVFLLHSSQILQISLPFPHPSRYH